MKDWMIGDKFYGQILLLFTKLETIKYFPFIAEVIFIGNFTVRLRNQGFHGIPK